eukprot:3931963-Rhodomonas_salina.2
MASTSAEIVCSTSSVTSGRSSPRNTSLWISAASSSLCSALCISNEELRKAARHCSTPSIAFATTTTELFESCRSK